MDACQRRRGHAAQLLGHRMAHIDEPTHHGYALICLASGLGALLVVGVHERESSIQRASFGFVRRSASMTAITMSTFATTVVIPSGSPVSTAPRSTASTGFT